MCYALLIRPFLEGAEQTGNSTEPKKYLGKPKSTQLTETDITAVLGRKFS